MIFPMKKEWYEKIKSGEKTVEYREVKPYWTSRFSREFDFGCGCISEIGESLTMMTFKHPIKLRLGYTDRYMTANIIKIEIVDGNKTDLHINKPVYAIHLANVREEKQ